METAIMNIMTKLDLSAFVFPTMICPAQPTWFMEDPTWECSTGDQWLPGYIANTIGWPEILVPMGFTEVGGPVGLSILGPKDSEGTLIGFTYDYEQGTMHHTAPEGFDALTGENFLVEENTTPDEEPDEESGVMSTTTVSIPFSLMVLLVSILSFYL